MKLWIKLSIFLTIVINILIQGIWLVIFPEIKSNSFELIGEKLKSIAVAASHSISGDEYEKLDFANPEVINDETFNKIRNNLIVLKSSLNISEDIYTLNLINQDTAQFGIMTNSKVFSGNKLQLKSPIAKAALLNTFNKDLCTFTEMYSDQYGEWISGLAPIKNSNGKIVGVIQVDHSAKTVSEKISSIEKFLIWLRIILIPIIIIISVFTAKYFTAPINKVVKLINQISNGNYSKIPLIKSSDEIKELVLSADQLRETILEQQENLFKTISELKEAIKKAEASDKMKGEFLAVLSHEIRTPLNVILGNVEILKMELEEITDRDFKEFTEPIKAGSLRLIRTVELIVQYSELTSGTYKLSEKFINAQDAIYENLLKYKTIAEENGLKLYAECNSSTSRIKADENLFNEILNQVIDNAVKYTKEGEIKICISDVKDSGLIISVQDTGIGISQEFMKELFKPFRQEDMSYTRRFEGNGLGLALAKKSCDVMNFVLKVTSEKNKGTTVEIVIPTEKLFNL